MRFCENYCIEDVSSIENYELAKTAKKTNRINKGRNADKWRIINYG